MKKIFAFILTLCMFLPLFGCAEQEEPAYRYIDGEGFDYIVLNMDFSNYKTDDCRATWHIDFESPEEMINDLKTGNLTEAELYELSRMRKDEQGRILIPDLDQLCRAAHPELTGLKRVRLEGGAKYAYSYEDAAVYFYSEEEFEDLAYSHYYYWITEETLASVRTRYAKKQENGEKYYFRYRYENDAWIAYISEWYDADGEEMGPLKSVDIYLENGEGAYLYIMPPVSADDFSAIDWLGQLTVEKP